MIQVVSTGVLVSSIPSADMIFCLLGTGFVLLFKVAWRWQYWLGVLLDQAAVAAVLLQLCSNFLAPLIISRKQRQTLRQLFPPHH